MAFKGSRGAAAAAAVAVVAVVLAGGSARAQDVVYIDGPDEVTLTRAINPVCTPTLADLPANATGAWQRVRVPGRGRPRRRARR